MAAGTAPVLDLCVGGVGLNSAALLASPSPRTQRAGGAAAAATLLAVYSANVQMAIERPPTSLTGVGLWLRLPMQFPMIAWALRVRRKVGIGRMPTLPGRGPSRPSGGEHRGGAAAPGKP